MWAALTRWSSLTVALLEDDKRLLGDGRRGEDWVGVQRGPYAIRHLPTLRLLIGEASYFLLLRGLQLRANQYTSVLIGGWESPAYWQTLLAARVRRLRCVGFYESTKQTNRFKKGPIAWARSWFFRNLDAVVVPGAAAREALVGMGVDKSRIIVGFNAVDVAYFHSESAGVRSRAIKMDSPGHNFVYVGQLIPRKNLFAVFNAYSRVREGLDRLTIVGSGELEMKLRTLSDSLGISDSVQFVGNVANYNLPAVLATQHTLVLVSLEEVWGLVVNEALAGGLHAVVSQTAGVAVSVKDMEGVYLSGASTDDIEYAMRLSRKSWKGPIETPEILQHTPERFAEDFAMALHLDVRVPEGDWHLTNSGNGIS